MHWSLSNIKRNGVIRYPGICIGESSCGREAILVWLESQDRGRLASPLHQQQGVEASWPHQAPASLHLPTFPILQLHISRYLYMMGLLESPVELSSITYIMTSLTSKA